MTKERLRDSGIAAKAFLICRSRHEYCAREIRGWVKVMMPWAGFLLRLVCHQAHCLSARECISPVSIRMQLGDVDGAEPHMVAAFDAVAAAYPSGSPVVAHQHSVLMQLYPDAKTK